MTVEIKGNSAAALTAGILLLSRARIFGQRFPVEIVGDPDDIATVPGPALLHSSVLASCGVGRELGSGAIIVVPGPASDPLAACLSADGIGAWFEIDRSGLGQHPATRALVALSREPRAEERELGRSLRRGLGAMGLSGELAVLDLLFGAPAMPLQRLALALRASRALGGRTEGGITRFLAPELDGLPDPLPSPTTVDELVAAQLDGRLRALIDRVSLRHRDPVEDWLDQAIGLARRRGEVAPLIGGLAEVGGHLCSLPALGMLPPLDPVMDGVAVHIGPALGAAGATDASRVLVDTFRFLGGRFTREARYPIEVSTTPPPAGRLERWRWLCEETRRVASGFDELWRRVVDLPA